MRKRPVRLYLICRLILHPHFNRHHAPGNLLMTSSNVMQENVNSEREL